MFWLLAGMMLGGFYGWLWALMIVGADADDKAMAEWRRRQDHFRKPSR